QLLVLPVGSTDNHQVLRRAVLQIQRAEYFVEYFVKRLVLITYTYLPVGPDQGTAEDKPYVSSLLNFPENTFNFLVPDIQAHSLLQRRLCISCYGMHVSQRRDH